MIGLVVRETVRSVSWSIMCRTAKRAHFGGWPQRANTIAFRAYCWAVPVRMPRG